MVGRGGGMASVRCPITVTSRGSRGVLVLILPDGYSDWVRLEKLERKRCKPYDIILIVLVRAEPPLTIKTPSSFRLRGA